MSGNTENAKDSERELIEYFRMVNGLDEPLGVSGLLPPAAAPSAVFSMRLPSDSSKPRAPAEPCRQIRPSAESA